MAGAQKLGEKMYAQAGAGAEQGGAEPGPGAAAGGGAEAKNEDGSLVAKAIATVRVRLKEN